VPSIQKISLLSAVRAVAKWVDFSTQRNTGVG
jgi:hypothetical protein